MPADPASIPPPHSWWQGLITGGAGRPDRLLVVQSDRHPDGVRVPMTADDAADVSGADLVCEAVLDHTGVSELHVCPTFAPRAPDLWYVELVEDSAQPAAVNLLAFGDGGPPAGLLLDADDVEDVPVTSADQLAAIRWYPATGEVDQIYVDPARRREHIGTALLAAAATLSVARDWPRLWTDGQRTVLGDQLTRSRSWAARAEDLTHVAPPMTPDAP